MPKARRRTAVIAKLPVFNYLLKLWIVLIVISMPVVFWQSSWGISLLWGFSVCLVPAMVFARYAGHIHGATNIRASVNRFYGAETAKFMLTTALFVVVFTRDVNFSVPVFLCAFIAAQVAQLIVTARVIRRLGQPGL
ncbi:ATP synthase subunit I [Gilvimarinus sp. SDUM040013]|nr:ATP synthase subunit I [Gilvimarinus sp. SDUM040013]